MHIGLITLFPEMFRALSEFGVSGRAVKQGLVELDLYNPRDFTTDKHRNVDDRPYGGGPGMVMLCEPLTAAIGQARSDFTKKGLTPRVVYMSPQGRTLEQSGVRRYSQQDGLILLCGRYEGIDERVITSLVDEECSIGDYVLSGGELAAMVLIDALSRLQPGALGHEDSARQDSFADGLLDYPHYSRPENYAGMAVPEVLLSGNHEAIRQWRLRESLQRTWLRRPELLKDAVLDAEQSQVLDSIRSEQPDTKN